MSTDQKEKRGCLKGKVFVKLLRNLVRTMVRKHKSFTTMLKIHDELSKVTIIE